MEATLTRNKATALMDSRTYQCSIALESSTEVVAINAAKKETSPQHLK
jgi:hypothetical protein